MGLSLITMLCSCLPMTVCTEVCNLKWNARFTCLYFIYMYIDVFSYDEDDMVEDPYLNKHLAHFGINIAAMQKVGANCILVITVFLFVYMGDCPRRII